MTGILREHLESSRSLPEAFYKIASAQPKSLVYSQAQYEPSNDRTETKRAWSGRSYDQVLPRVEALARALLLAGVVAGDRVAILSNTRPEWMEADLAILSVGAVTVSVYQSLTANDIGYILFDSQAQIVFAENQEQLDKLLSIDGKHFPIAETEERPAGEVTIHLKKIITFEQSLSHPLVWGFDNIVEQATQSSSVVDQWKNLNRESLAALVYTSGTTGAPKGVMQTHGNHLANVRQAFDAGMYNEQTSIFLLLPLAHSFAKLMGYIGFLTPATILFPAITDRQSSKANPASVTKDMREANAKLIPVVPRLLEKMQSGVLHKSKERSLQGAMLKLALAAGTEITKGKYSGPPAPFFSVVLYWITGVVRRKVRRQLFGINFESVVSGGAKLPIEVAKFFDSIGCEVLEGYGLTETCVATNVNRRGKVRLGTVGPVLASDILVKVAEDGEVLFKGPNITSGYWNRAAATKQSWDGEGWFHTGDLGSLTADGILAIEGRKKELIVTSGGKKIPPDPIENKLKAGGFISQAVLVGEGRKYCVALVTLETGAVKSWAAKNGHKLEGLLHEAKPVIELMQREMERVNATLASFESIKRIAILHEELTVENGLLTPTFKVKRKEINARFASLIDSLY